MAFAECCTGERDHLPSPPFTGFCGLSASITEIGRRLGYTSRIALESVEQAINDRIAKLSDSIQRIGDVVKPIGEVAGQTNPLVRIYLLWLDTFALQTRGRARSFAHNHAPRRELHVINSLLCRLLAFRRFAASNHVSGAAGLRDEDAGFRLSRSSKGATY